MKVSWTLIACMLVLHIVSANKRQPADVFSKRGGRGKAVSDFIDIDEAAGEFESSGNGADNKNDEGTDDSEASGDVIDDTIEASGDDSISIELTDCQMKREQSLSSSSVNSTRKLKGQFVPNCAPDGHYELVQCHTSTGYCWCVNRMDGAEIAGSRRRAPDQPSCVHSGKSFDMVETTSYSTTVIPSTERSTSSKSLTKMTSSVALSSIPTKTYTPSSMRSTTAQRTTTTTTTTTTRPSTSVFSSTQSADYDNKINQIPNESDISVDVEPDTDNNYVERPNVMIEPKARKMTLRSTIVGQPGILAGIIGAAVIVLLCLVLLIMFCIYRVHRKSQDPAIYYIDKPLTGRSSLPSSNKKAGYMKALDHDVYS